MEYENFSEIGGKSEMHHCLRGDGCPLLEHVKMLVCLLNCLKEDI